jgi:PAS domain S-box-containing protein
MDPARTSGLNRKSLAMLAVVVIAVIGGWTVMNVWFGRAAGQVARDQFNEEQLVVARNARYWIEKQLAVLGKELELLAKKVESGASDPLALYPLLQPSFERVLELGVDKIELVDTRQEWKYTYYPYRVLPERSTLEPGEVEPAAATSPNASRIRVREPDQAGPEMHLSMDTALNHPLLAQVTFQVHLSWFLGPFLKHIRSGKSGYAWIMDDRGRFLFHPHTPFIGKSAFEARQERDPGISLQLINTIQKESMLRGREGTGSYYSAWHRGITGRVEKLIAFTPIVISDLPPRKWSVAVVAPVYEIEAALDQIQRWQLLLQGMVLLIVMAAAGGVLYFQLRWSRRLEALVAARTQALKRSEENYRSLVESAEDFIFTVDGQGRLLSVNSFTAASFGGTPEEFVGQGLDRLFTTEIAARQIKIVRTVCETGKSVRDEFELTVGDTPIWISANFMPLKNEAGRMGAVLCIARDITENKRLERFLINTEKLASLGTLAAGVAHEINNPLGVMLGFCDLLVRKKAPGSQEYEDLKIIERQGMQCKQIVENLLSFARVGQEKTTDTDLNECLGEIIKVVRHSLEMKDIELRTEFANPLPRVRGDDRQLQQVFLNLINNAAAAMPAGGRLTLRTAPVAGGQRAALQVRDQGTGIAPEHLDHIFEPFFTTKPEGEGTGLGLFVSYGIINKYGGTITCESQDHDGGERPRGTIFTVELPAHAGEEK